MDEFLAAALATIRKKKHVGQIFILSEIHKVFMHLCFHEIFLVKSYYGSIKIKQIFQDNASA
jgi:hypothetical protein